MTPTEALKEHRRKIQSGEIERQAVRNPHQRWQEKNTRKTAVDAFCWQCMGGEPDASNGAIGLIRACPSSPTSINPCPLWQWRPYK